MNRSLPWLWPGPFPGFPWSMSSFAFSSGRSPRHDMDHSGSREKQANSVGNRNGRSNGDGAVLRLQLAAVGI
jgi:hypothetical protein